MAAGSTATRRAWRHAPARKLFCVVGRPVQSRVLLPLPTCQNEGFARDFTPPNQTLIMVNARLPKGNLDGGNAGGTAAWTLLGQASSRDLRLRTIRQPRRHADRGTSGRHVVGDHRSRSDLGVIADAEVPENGRPVA